MKNLVKVWNLEFEIISTKFKRAEYKNNEYTFITIHPLGNVWFCIYLFTFLQLFFFFFFTMCFFVVYCFLKMPFLSFEQSWIRSWGTGKLKTVGLHRQVSVCASHRLIYFSIFQGKVS